jgi:23S rRNA pseudouridine2605 synthase
MSRQKLRSSRMTAKKKKDLNPAPIAPELESTPAVESEPTVVDGPAPGTGTELEAEIFAEELAENESEAASEVDPESEEEPEPDAESEIDPEANFKEEPEAESEAESEDEVDPDFKPAPRPPAKLERLQKILAAAGVASRRSAEAMIEQGRVQVNGKVVTELGTKADAGRDHIRVDGKLLQGAERLRYFILNKPKGFVTTVKDPEGRPTVMQFFDKLKERLYPVGRLDYMSEGLLLVTNDGDLANRLTKASSGVEKTYLVKVAGQPSEAELDILRAGVSIERGKPGSGQVRTSPARIRQVRQGDNPWYEVVLIEGRNRELRKMFEEVGHFVEKIRRVGYGPLVLDQEPGNLRELQPTELDALRRAAEGKARTPKSKEVRRRNAMDAAGLPTVAPKPTSHPRPAKPFTPKPSEDRSASAERPSDFRPKKTFGADRAKPFRPAAGSSAERPRRAPSAGPAKYGAAKFSPGGPAKPPYNRDRAPGSFTPRPPRPEWKRDDRPAPPPARFAAGATGESRPSSDRPGSDRPRPSRPFSDRPRPGGPAGAGRTGGGRSFGAKPAWNKSGPSSDRPAYKRPSAPRREAQDRDDDLGPVRPPNLHIEEVSNFDRPTPTRSSAPRTGSPRSYSDRPAAPSRPRSDRPASDRPAASRPFRSEGGLARPFTTSSGKPRAGGARPSSKPGKAGATRPYSATPKGSFDSRTGAPYRPSAAPGKRPFRRDAGEGSFTPRPPAGPRSEGARPERRNNDTGWKPKTRYGGSGKPASGGHSKPGGFSKSGFKGKSSGSGFKGKSSGSGPKRSGYPGGKKRG